MRAKRRKNKASHRSPYAKSLELKQYRHRVDRDKRSSFDDWTQEQLEEYHAEMDEVQKQKKKPKGRDNLGRDDTLGATGEVVEPKGKGEGEKQ